MTAVPGAPGPLRLGGLLLLSSSPRRGSPGTPAVASISVRSRLMATLQVTAWQLWGTHHKTGSMEHNQDTDAPVPADELLESPAILTRFFAAPFALRHSVLVFWPRFIRRPLFSPCWSPPISKSR